MDTSRVSFGEMIAAAGGVALLVLMFLPWFGGRLSGIAPARVATHTGWESFATLPKFLLVLAAVLPVAVAVAQMRDSLPALPIGQGEMVIAAGSVAFLIVVLRLLDPPGVIEVAIPNVEVDPSRKPAAYLALAAAGVIAYGGFLQRRERT